jgi:hypothetical protein
MPARSASRRSCGSWSGRWPGDCACCRSASRGCRSEAREAFAREATRLAHAHGARVLVNGDLALARHVGADGVHLPCAQLMQLAERPDLPLVAASCHNPPELARAAALELDFAVLGPVKESLSHPGVAGLGWARCRAVAGKCFAAGVRPRRAAARRSGGGAAGRRPRHRRHPRGVGLTDRPGRGFFVFRHAVFLRRPGAQIDVAAALGTERTEGAFGTPRHRLAAGGAVDDARLRNLRHDTYRLQNVISKTTSLSAWRGRASVPGVVKRMLRAYLLALISGT